MIAGAPAAPFAHAASRSAVRRAVLVAVVPVVLYFVVRPFVDSDAAGLAFAGLVPLGHTVVSALRRRVDPWAVVTSLGFALGCLASLLAGGSSLPLKLHEAAITFVLGVVLLGAVLLNRPLPIGRLLKVHYADRRLDATLSLLIGAFLVLHALVHVALAVTLPTDAYLIAGRLVNWASIAVGAGCLYAYLRRLRHDAPSSPVRKAR